MKTKELEIDYIKWFPLLTVILLTLVLSLINPDFISLYNIKSLLTQTSVLVILSCGMTFVLLT